MRPFSVWPIWAYLSRAAEDVSSSTMALWILVLFLALVFVEVLPHTKRLFFVRRGWSHRILGGLHFGLLVWGAIATAAACYGMTSVVEDEAAIHNVGNGVSDQSSSNSNILHATNYNQTTSLFSELLLPFFSFTTAIPSNWHLFWLLYDIMLGCSGMATTLSAARDFPHKSVRNQPGQSGSLEQHAIVTQSEMIEHSFYQGLNLLQAVYLHAIWKLRDNNYWDIVDSTTSGARWENQLSRFLLRYLSSMGPQLACLWLVTAPWLVRNRFPVNSFSQNWANHAVPIPTKPTEQINAEQDNERDTTKDSIGKAQEPIIQNASRQIQTFRAQKLQAHQQSNREEILLYRIKKAQYLFYKHVLLHGLNISMALGKQHGSDIPNGISWRVYWLLLNTSYVMEFFLQTLVKRKVLSQNRMLIFQRLLMVGASLAAIRVLLLCCGGERMVITVVCLLSLLLNLVHRHHEVMNTLGIAVVSGFVQEYYLYRTCGQLFGKSPMPLE